MFYWYHQPPIGLFGAESIQLETLVSGLVRDPFYWITVLFRSLTYWPDIIYFFLFHYSTDHLCLLW